MRSTTTDSAVHTISTQKSLGTHDLVLGGMFAGLLAVISQFSIPMPSGVPITIQMFGVTLVGVILGWRLALLATITYILIGAAGLPVFANFRGGLSSLTGLTGGYIWSWPIMAALCGIRPITGKKSRDFTLTVIFCLVGLMISEAVGGLQWAALSSDMTMKAVFLYAVIAFIPKDIVLTILAVFVGIPMRRIVFRRVV